MVNIQQDHLGFALPNSKIRNGVFIPKFYNPELFARLRRLKATHQLLSVKDLKDDGYLSVATGDEIGKMAYGTGEIPFIRTSDIVNWEVKADPKHGVSEELYSAYSAKQDVREGDIFFVRDGTYLIGQACLLTKHDLPCLYQSHILKFRLTKASPISPYLFLACLNGPTVKQQIRSTQFTADIIDTIGNRYLDLMIPVPKERSLRVRIAHEVELNITKRISLRERIRKIPLWVEGQLKSLDAPVPEDWLWRTELVGNPGFIQTLSDIKGSIFIPKYYDPQLDDTLKGLKRTHELATLNDLLKDSVITWDTGIEIGKMAYGTGHIPFIRTSDISNWELKGDPKQSVSDEIYEENKQDVQAEDIFVVRDGTYLVGTSCILTENDTKILYCGGLYKLRVKDKGKLDPYLLLAILNTPIVRRQMRAKQFTRDIIDTLGKRLFEVVLPIPKNTEIRKKIADETRRVIEKRVELRNRAREIAFEVEGIKFEKMTVLESLEGEI
ncbi:MAG: hypothetical protein M1497_01655 [Nitrospirae bacterium]|nr:hypothetical protein [Nitrospirota bacterium]